MEILYFADPMCSWCYGFVDALAQAERSLASGVRLRYLMGGLAPDSTEPMPDATRAMVMNAWDEVERASGASFNRAFWTDCAPRRSTWPACRAVIAAEAREPGAGRRMFAAIQRAYYREARNPSDVHTLVELAAAIGLDATGFADEVDGQPARQRLAEDRALAGSLGMKSYPTLVARTDVGVQPVTVGWTRHEPLVARLRELGAI